MELGSNHAFGDPGIVSAEKYWVLSLWTWMWVNWGPSSNFMHRGHLIILSPGWLSLQRHNIQSWLLKSQIRSYKEHHEVYLYLSETLLSLENADHADYSSMCMTCVFLTHIWDMTQNARVEFKRTIWPHIFISCSSNTFCFFNEILYIISSICFILSFYLRWGTRSQGSYEGKLKGTV